MYVLTVEGKSIGRNGTVLFLVFSEEIIILGVHVRGHEVIVPGIRSIQLVGIEWSDCDCNVNRGMAADFICLGAGDFAQFVTVCSDIESFLVYLGKFLVPEVS